MERKDNFSIDLRDENGRLDFAQQIFQRFCDDLMDDADKARTRAISNIQIGIREALNGGHVEPLFYTAAQD